MDYTIDLGGVTDVAGLHDLLLEKLSLPVYYGRNLDALYDILSERGNVRIEFQHSRQAFAAIGFYMERFERMCNALQEEYSLITIKFV